MLKKDTSEIAVGLAAAFIGLVLLLSFYIFKMDMRWLAVLLIGLIGLAIFQRVQEKEILLLYLAVFLLPYTGGFLYSPLVVNDLIFAFDVFLFLLIGIWLIETGGFQDGALYIHKSTIPAILMVVWAMLGIPFCISKLSATLGTFLLVKAFLFYFYIINRVKTKRQLKIIINMLLVGIGIQGLLGLLQRVLGHGLGLGFLGEKQANYTSEISRVRGTLAVPNQYGAYLILLIPIAASFYISAKNKKEKYWYSGILALAIFGLFFSLSRSSWFGLIGAIIVMLVILYKKKQLSPKLLKGIVVISFVMVLLVIIFWNVIVLRFQTGEQGQFRKVMIEIAFPIIFSHPIFGVGLFNYQYHSFSSFRFWHPVHNTILRVTAEYGFPGLFFFIWFIVLIYREASKNLKLKDSYLRTVALGVIGGYTAFLIAVQFGPEYQHYRQKVVFWILGAITIALKRIAKNELMLQKKMEMKNKIKEPRVLQNVGSDLKMPGNASNPVSVSYNDR